jgi:hypothetical protein
VSRKLHSYLLVFVRDIGPDAIILVVGVGESEELTEQIRTESQNVARVFLTDLDELYFLSRSKMDRNVMKVAAVCLGNIYQIVRYPGSIQSLGHCSCPMNRG